MPCPKCGGPLKTEEIGEAGCYIHYCPNPECKPTGYISGAYLISSKLNEGKRQ